MLALVTLLLLGQGADPADEAPPAPLLSTTPPDPESSAVAATLASQVHTRVKSVNGVGVGSESPKIWPLDDVVVSADETHIDGTYRWLLVSKPDDSNVAITAADQRETGFYFDLDKRKVAGLDEAGDYRVRLILTTSAGPVTRDMVIHVAWPSTPPPAWKPPASDKVVSSDVRQSMTVGSLTGCGVGACGTCAVAGLGAATISAGGPGALACGALACGPCATTGAVIGAAVGASNAKLEIWQISPWVLTGAGVELAGFTLLIGSALVGTGTIPLAPAGSTSVPDQTLLVGTGVIGVVAIVAGGPATVAAAYFTAPEPSSVKTR